MKKSFWPLFSRNIECHKHQGTTYKGPQGNLTFTVEVTRSFLHDLTGRCKHKFLKKRQSFQWREVFGIFVLAILMWRTLRDDLQGSTRCSDNCGSYRIFSVTPKRLFRTQIFFKKKQPFHRKKNWPRFSGLSILTNIWGRLIEVQTVFWHVLWMS